MTLTQRERNTLNAAEKILVRTLKHPTEVLMLSLHGSWESFSSTYFTPAGVQHGSLWTGEGCTFADKIERAISIRDEEEANAENAKAERIRQLENQLANLKGEAV